MRFIDASVDSSAGLESILGFDQCAVNNAICLPVFRRSYFWDKPSVNVRWADVANWI
jgi:hypothetical protein